MTISNIATTATTSTSVTVTWTTDVPSTSQVLLLETNCWQPTSRHPEPADATLTTSHSVTITGLCPSSYYGYCVAGFDAAGKYAISYEPYSCGGHADAFTTAAINTAATLDYRCDLEGPRCVRAGSDLWIDWNNVLLAGPVDHLTFTSVSGLPVGIGFTVSANYSQEPSAFTCNGNQYVWSGNSRSFCVRLRVGADVRPGWYTATMAVQSGTVTKWVPWTFEVLPASAPLAIAAAPQPLDLTKWESNMKTVGQKWADWMKATPLSFGVEQQVWYYDGGRTYLQVADYTKDSAWIVPARTILDQYAAYVNGAQGNIPGYRKFPFGLMMDTLRNGTASSKQAVTNLYNAVSTPYINGASPVNGQLVAPLLMRELSYALDCMIAGERIGLPRSPYMARTVDGALGFCDELFHSNPALFNQPFMDGLLLESLIAYYALTRDPRVPSAVKQCLDWLWANAVNHSTYQINYACLYPQPIWITELNNLICPAWAWYANLTGDKSYQDQGDRLFLHALDTDITYTGKIYSQNYKWSFDFVRWRNGQPSTID